MTTRLSAIVLLLAAFVPVLLTGCWDRTEVNDLAFVMASAVDLEESGEYRVSVQLPLAGQLGGAKGGGGGSGGTTPYYIDSETGSTLSEATAKLQKRMAREMFFGHRRVILVGERLARQGLHEVFDSIARNPQSRLTTFLVVTHGKASELLNTEPKMERFSGEAIRELAKSRRITPVTIKDISLMMGGLGSDPVIIYMQAAKNQVGKSKSNEAMIDGYAQFREDKLVHVLRDDAIMGLSMLRGNFRKLPMTVPRSGASPFALVVDSGQLRIKPVFRDDRIIAEVSIEATAFLQEDQQFEDSSRTEVLRQLEEAMAGKIKNAVSEVMDSMKTYRTDTIALGKLIHRRYPARWKELRADWRSELARLEYRVEVKANIGNIGLVSDNISTHPL